MKLKNNVILVLVYVFFSAIIIFAQNKYPSGLADMSNFGTVDAGKGGLIGKVIDEKGEPLVGANIFIMENKFGASSCIDGSYSIGNLPAGTYTVKVSFVGYHTVYEKVLIVNGRKTELNIKLASESFEIGGIRVIGTSELLPTEINTRTSITSAEIEHFQATNLKDVLSLIPGIQRSDNPGLDKPGNVAIRGSGNDSQFDLSAFGTLIMVDGARESNNANMQFEGLAGGKYGGLTQGRGLDLRQIPADNIESIEVIAGLPSVRYGDFTSGIIDIKTKIGAAPHRIKIKNNPTTNEGNIGGGFKLGDYNSLSYNVNIARSERDLRLEGDEYTRYTGQLVFSDKSLDGKFTTNYKLSGQAIMDEEEPKGDYSQTKNYNRSYSIGLNTWGSLKSENGLGSLDYSAYMKMNNINLRKSKLVQSDLRILPNGDTVSIYTGVLENNGKEWNAGGRIEYGDVFYTGNFINKYLVGAEFDFDANTGEGIVIDTLYNYYGSDSRRKPRRFDALPGQALVSMYAEDKITGKLYFDFSLSLGFRYEMYRPHGFNIKGLWGDGDLVESYQGSFFNPRINLMIYLSQDRQIRMSAGRTSKSPPMGSIYSEDKEIRWRDPNTNTVKSFIINTMALQLQGYQETQYEISYDEKLFNTLGLSVSAYYKERQNAINRLSNPYFYTDNTDNVFKLYYLGDWNKAENIGRYYSKGIEATLKTSRIRDLNMTFKVTGSYNFSKNPGGYPVYDNYPDASLGQYPNYKVPGIPVDTLFGWTYSGSGNWYDEVVINYFVKYTHPTLGLWVTLRAEQVLKERRQSFNLVPVNYDMLTPSQLESRMFSESIKTKPSKWLFALNVSKSLFKGAEVSFYVNNFLDDPAINTYMSSPTVMTDESRNPELFYGLEFSMILDNIFN